MSKNIILIGLIFEIILIFGCVQQEKSITDLPSIEVTYSIGSGWTGWHETLIINNDGLVNFEEQKPFDGNKTTKSIQLPSTEIQEFKQLINDANVFSFKDDYDCDSNCPTDLPSSSIKFIIDGNEKTISMYAPQNMPNSLEQILQKIEDIEEKFK